MKRIELGKGKTRLKQETPKTVGMSGKIMAYRRTTQAGIDADKKNF